MEKSAERMTARRHGAPLIAIAAGLFVWIVAMGAMIVMPEDRTVVARDVLEPTGILILHQDARTYQTVAIREARPL